MLNFSPEKLLLLGILALVVLGPSRLPQAARTLGRVLAEVRRVSGSFHTEVREALVDPRDALNSAVGDLGINDLRTSLRNTVTGAVTPAETTAHATPVSGSAPTVDAPAPAPDDPSLN